MKLVFDGVKLIAETDKILRGCTHVFMNYTTLDALKRVASQRHEQLVHLGNPEFEEEFVIYTNAADEARSILTTPLMEHMLELKRRRNIDMRFCFSGSHVSVDIHNFNARDPDPFDPDFDIPATDAAQAEKIFACFAFYLGIIDDLGLNADAKAQP